VKSKLDAEFRRFSVKRSKTNFAEFEKMLEELHSLQNIPFIVCYTEPNHGDLLPINNDDNFIKAITLARPLLRLLIQRKGESYGEVSGYGTMGMRKKNPLSKLIQGEPRPRPSIQISMPEDFRRVSAIIDVDVVPETHRRVKLMKNGTEKPLGFYIRDGTSYRVTPHGVEKVAGIFISRLVPGGLAESTGLLAVNDEVLEVNGIEVSGKSLDQVTDMMVANSSNLIITVKPVNQLNNVSPKRGAIGRMSQKSTGSLASGQSMDSDEIRDIINEDEEDEVHDYLSSETKNNDNTQSSMSSNPSSTSEGDKQKDKDSAVVTL